MAKRTSIDNIKAIDTDSVEEAAATDNTTALQTRDDDSLTATETRDDEVNAEDVTDETEQIREQIVETRREMSETIDAIQEKLSFSNISEQVKDQVSEQISGAVESAKDAFYGKAGYIINTVGKGLKGIGKTDLAKKAQQNPQVLAIVGAGIGALLVGALIGGGKKKKRASYRYENFDNDDDDIRYTDEPRRELKSGKPGQSGESKDSTFQTVKSKVGDTASSAFEGVSSVATTAYSGVSSAAGSAYEGVGNAASKTYKGIGTAAGYTYDKAGDLGEQVMKNYDYYIEENPLAVGAVALALGAAVGFAIPLTKKENEYLGEYRDNIVEKAQATAQDAIGTVKQMAGEAQKIIVEEVKTQTAS